MGRMKGQVQVYRNLHKTTAQGTAVYSVRNDKGIVEDHVTSIALWRPIFRVALKGNQKVRDEKRKNVHAYIQGRRIEECPNYFLPQPIEYGSHFPLKEEGKSLWQQITYNPYKHKSFVLVEDESFEVRKALSIEIKGGKVWAFLPE